MRFYLRNDFADRPGAYYVCWTDESGRPHRRSARTRDHGAAQTALARLVLEHDKPRDQRPEDVTVQAVVLRYFWHHGRTRASRDPIRYALAKVNAHLPRVTVAEFDRPRQVAFLRALTDDGCGASTASRYMGVIRSALRWAADNQELPETKPLARPEAEESEGVPPFTLEEMRKVVEACVTEGERMLVLLWLGTACRPGAAVDLDWPRVTPATIDFRVPGSRITKKRRAVVPVAPSLSAYLEARRSVGPVVRSEKHTKVVRPIKEWKKKFQRICQRAGVPGSGYRVRKFVATWLRGHGVPEADVSAMLAHRFGGTQTERYAQARPDFMAAARDGIERMLHEIAPSWLPLASRWQVANDNSLFSNVANSDSYKGE